MSKYEALFTPLKVGGVTIKNRFVHAPMEGTAPLEWTTGYKFNEHAKEYLLERARNEVGLIIPGIITVKSMIGGKWLYKSGKKFQKELTEFMDEIHKNDCKMFVQLGAGFGRVMVMIDMLAGLMDKKFLAKMLKVNRITASPSELPSVWDPKRKCPEITVEEIKEIIEGYGKGAKVLKDCGVDGVEIHAIHEGYLLDQFTIKNTNNRTDEYGGSLENRARFVTDIIKAIKAECGEDFPVVVRYSVTSKMRGFNKGALPGEKFEEFGRDYEESSKLAKILEEAGADALDADNGSYDSWYWAHPPMYMPLACNLDDAKFIKKHVNIPVFCAGRMEDPNTAVEVIESKEIDAVAIGRQFLADPEYVTKVKNDNLDDIKPCLACHNACFAVAQKPEGGANMASWGNGKCAITPYTLNESARKLKPLANKKKIVVIGAGIAGMEFARIATLRGHDVTIYEKSNELGGVFIAAAAPKFKEKDKMLLKWYAKQMKDLNIKIEFNHEVTEEELKTLEADEIIYAVGANRRNLNVDGGDKAIDAIEYLRGEKEVGENVVIIGGGLTGCEIAYDAVLNKKKPVIIEAQQYILNMPLLCAANSNMLKEIIRYYEIPVYTSAKVLKITDNEVVIEKDGKEQIIVADTVVKSIGYNNSGVEIKGNFHVIGDALKVGNLKDVIWTAYDLANEL
ncbi:MAG: FAD-dependent oxidoreductase [Bacilli bacterium]|nr:FAD-dependent oxidoreductase [Bacilli bacterium]